MGKKKEKYDIFSVLSFVFCLTFILSVIIYFWVYLSVQCDSSTRYIFLLIILSPPLALLFSFIGKGKNKYKSKDFNDSSLMLSIAFNLLLILLFLGGAFSFDCIFFEPIPIEHADVTIYGKKIRIDRIEKLDNESYTITISSIENRDIKLSDLGSIIIPINSSSRYIKTSNPKGFPVFPGKTGSFTIPQSSCPQGTTLKVIAPGNEDQETCP